MAFAFKVTIYVMRNLDDALREEIDVTKHKVWS